MASQDPPPRRRETGRGLTLEDVAARAGVSRSTVSRVLNGLPEVRPEVRERVQAEIRGSGYRPNNAARALAMQRTRLIGLLMVTQLGEMFGDPYYSALVHGIQLGCIASEQNLAIFPVVRDEDPELLRRQMDQSYVDGLIITASPASEEVIGLLRSTLSDLVVIGCPADPTSLVRVDVDNQAGSAEMVEHLIGHGYRRIAYLGPDLAYVYGEQRYAGYREAMTRHDLPDTELVRFAPPTIEGGRMGIAALTAAFGSLDAVFVATDTMAVGVIDWLSEHQVQVPADLALASFDGLDSPQAKSLQLSTVVQPVANVGRAAVELLGNPTRKTGETTLPTQLRLGASCGCHLDR